ncbi:Transcription initiation factor TFIID subunit 9 [Boothiomyces sp. JEL0866]|nr:Transcription initiation factor TFIID subunit 9 [Boothiomyces sp. JEL0866]
MYEAFQDPNELPPTARLISLILQGASVEDYEPRVLAQLYEVMHSYILNVLQDAQLYADHAEHKELSVADVKLAIETRATLDFTNPPSRQKRSTIDAGMIAKKQAITMPTPIQGATVPVAVNSNIANADDDYDME